tara:strand:+ start:1337 stop:1897 length:561 start_codon:yes stop_codon:yes gene_type:complete
MAFSFTSKGFKGFDPSIGKKIGMNVLSVQSLFRKFNEDGKRIKHEGYPFLNSRYSTSNTGMKNPMTSIYRGRGPNQELLEKFNIEKNLRTYYGGNEKMRGFAEKQAKSSYKTYRMLNKNLYKASKIYDKNPLKANTMFSKSIAKAYEMHRKNAHDTNIATHNKNMITEFASAFIAPQVRPLFRSFR